jgi:hypothetical protein
VYVIVVHTVDVMYIVVRVCSFSDLVLCVWLVDDVGGRDLVVVSSVVVQLVEEVGGLVS